LNPNKNESETEVCIKLVVYYVTMMHGQQNIKFHKVPVILRNDLLRQSYQPLRQVRIAYNKLSKCTSHCGDNAKDNGLFDLQ
jgi:hypothetical protein